MIIILTTVSKKQDASKLATSLIKEKLAACVNIIKIEKSIYRWKGKVEEQGEYLLIIKTIAPKYLQLERFIKKHHPYELPEIVKINVEGGSNEYLQWVANP